MEINKVVKHLIKRGDPIPLWQYSVCIVQIGLLLFISYAMHLVALRCSKNFSL